MLILSDERPWLQPRPEIPLEIRARNSLPRSEGDGAGGSLPVFLPDMGCMKYLSSE